MTRIRSSSPIHADQPGAGGPSAEEASKARCGVRLYRGLKEPYDPDRPSRDPVSGGTRSSRAQGLHLSAASSLAVAIYCDFCGSLAVPVTRRIICSTLGTVLTVVSKT